MFTREIVSKRDLEPPDYGPHNLAARMTAMLETFREEIDRYRGKPIHDCLFLHSNVRKASEELQPWLAAEEFANED